MVKDDVGPGEYDDLHKRVDQLQVGPIAVHVLAELEYELADHEEAGAAGSGELQSQVPPEGFADAVIQVRPTIS